MSDHTTLADHAYRIRRFALRMGEVQGQGYIGQALGYADVLAVAYGHALDYRADDPQWEGRDRFLLSHGHYAIAFYAVSIGLYHPPIGTTLFITASIAKVRIGDVVKELIPFYFVAIALLLGFAYLPWLTLR